MRYAALRDKRGGFAQAQKREEREMFRCYYQAVPLAKMDGQRTNLELVRVNLIEGDKDLTKKVFIHFLNVCIELNVPGITTLLDTLKFDPNHEGKGNGYRIPSKDKDFIGHMKAKARRQAWRAGFREEFSQPELESVRDKLRVIKGGIG